MIPVGHGMHRDTELTAVEIFYELIHTAELGATRVGRIN